MDWTGEEKFITYGFEWKCDQSKLLGVDHLTEVYSDPFITAQNGILYKWRAMVTPAGSKASKKHMGMYLKLVQGISPAVKVQLGHLSYVKSDYFKTDHRINDVYFAYTRIKLLKINHSFGIDGAIKLKQQNDQYSLPFKCQEVTFFFTFRVSTEAFKLEAALPKPMQASEDKTAQMFYKATLENPRGSTIDITLVSKEGHKVYAHSCILAGKSEMFSRLLSSPLHSEGCSEIVIDDLEAVVLKELIHFAYLNALSADIKDHVELIMEAAHRYLFEDLVLQCEKYMVEKLLENKAERCVEYYCLAKLYSLKNVSTGILIENWTNLQPIAQLQPFMDDLSITLVEISRCHLQIPNEDDMENTHPQPSHRRGGLWNRIKHVASSDDSENSNSRSESSGQ